VDSPAWFERIGPGDAQQLATDVGPVPANVGALLVLGPPDPPALDPDALADLIAGRLAAIPRMRQRLARVPLGCGRPIWVDDGHVHPRRHVDVVACPGRGSSEAVMAAAVATVTQPLDGSGPLWRARVLTGLPDGQVGLVLVLHHVLADGIGGLAMLGGLVDEAFAGAPPTGPLPAAVPAAVPAPVQAPRPMPTRRMLLADATRMRMRALRRAPRQAAMLGSAMRELGREGSGMAPRCSLNQPTGPRRAAAVVSVPLDPLRRLAREHAATVNDVLLVAVARALEAVLASRGEHLPSLVISVPVAARGGTTTDQLGNQVGVMPVRVPLGGPARETLAQVARSTAARRTEQRGSSAALVTPAFRLLAALHLFGPLIERQRLVNSFLTNMRGPAHVMTLAGAPIQLIAPLTIATGNVSAAFAALSYAGTLNVVVITDPDLIPEGEDLSRALRQALSCQGSSSG
jgi:WS/DGAT/MGAT family acyltransferase